MKKTILFALAVVLTVPSFAQNIIPKPPRPSQSVVLQQGLINEETVNGAKQVGTSAMYYSQVSGGSALLGFLLGPIGGLVNMAAIEDKKEQESKSGAFSNSSDADLHTLVETALKNNSIRNTPASATTTFIEPFILVRRNRDDQLLTSLVFVAAQKEGDSVLWSEKYYYHFKEKLPADILSNGDGTPLQKLLRENIPSAVNELSQFVLSDLSGNLADGSEVVLNSERFGPFPIPFKGYTIKDDNGKLLIRVIANNIHNLYARGMHIIAKEDVEFQ